MIATVVQLVVRSSTSSKPSAVAYKSNGTPPITRSSPTVAWVDYLGDLHVGNALTGREQVIRQVRAEPTTPLVSLGGRLLWVETKCTYVPTAQCPYSSAAGFSLPTAEEYDPASKATRNLGLAQAIFPSADKKSVFIVRRRVVCEATCNPYAEELVQVPVSRAGQTRQFPVPLGWYVNAGSGYSNPIAVAGRVLVQSALAQAISEPKLGLWKPGSASVEQLGRDWGLIDAYTPPNSRSSLLAWLPGSCLSGPRCQLLITNTATRRSIAVDSPLPYGFDIGGAFSPDGASLAVFVRTNSGAVNPAMQLAMVNTHTGALRPVPGVEGQIGESVGWARWLPDGTRVLAGTFSSNYRTYNHYLVNARTGAAKVVDFSDDRDLDANFSTTVVIP